VAYDADLDLVRSTLEAITQGLPWRSAGEDPVVGLTDFGTSTVNYTVHVGSMMLPRP